MKQGTCSIFIGLHGQWTPCGNEHLVNVNFTSSVQMMYVPCNMEKNVNVGFESVIYVSALFTGAHRFTKINIIFK